MRLISSLPYQRPKTRKHAQLLTSSTRIFQGLRRERPSLAAAMILRDISIVSSRSAFLLSTVGNTQDRPCPTAQA